MSGDAVADHPVDLCADCKTRVKTWLSGNTPEEVPPLTREKIVQAMKNLGVWETVVPGQQKKFYEALGRHVEDAILSEWAYFYEVHAAELLSLALTAIEHIKPRRAKMRYKRKNLCFVQDAAVKALASGPKTTRELLIATKGSDRNLRRTMDVLHARGVVSKAKSPTSATVWSLAEAQKETAGSLSRTGGGG